MGRAAQVAGRLFLLIACLFIVYQNHFIIFFSSCMRDILARMVPSIPHNMTSTTFDLPGYRVERSLGLVRGIIVRSRSVFGTIGAGLQTIIGGNITLLTNLCERTREDAFDLMLQHASEFGANAVLGVRYDATEIMQGVTEVLAYGTAVWVEKI